MMIVTDFRTKVLKNYTPKVVIELKKKARSSRNAG